MKPSCQLKIPIRIHFSDCCNHESSWLPRFLIDRQPGIRIKIFLLSHHRQSKQFPSLHTVNPEIKRKRFIDNPEQAFNCGNAASSPARDIIALWCLSLLQSSGIQELSRCMPLTFSALFLESLCCILAGPIEVLRQVLLESYFVFIMSWFLRFLLTSEGRKMWKVVFVNGKFKKYLNSHFPL